MSSGEGAPILGVRPCDPFTFVASNVMTSKSVRWPNFFIRSFKAILVLLPLHPLSRINSLGSYPGFLCISTVA